MKSKKRREGRRGGETSCMPRGCHLGRLSGRRRGFCSNRGQLQKWRQGQRIVRVENPAPARGGGVRQRGASNSHISGLRILIKCQAQVPCGKFGDVQLITDLYKVQHIAPQKMSSEKQHMVHFLCTPLPCYAKTSSLAEVPTYM